MCHCKDCRHAEEDDDIFTPQSAAIGILLLHVPMPNINRGRLKCDNIDSIYYGDYVDDYDECDDFKTKKDKDE
jgi:hypothetical protein